MTGPVAAAADTRELVEQVTTGGLRSLHPADGLFLRAEHLQQIQAYARELSQAVAVAGGAGVAYGYQLAAGDTTLTVKPGLAFDAGGRALRSHNAVTLDLTKLTDRAGRFWIVQVTYASPLSAGSEPVFGDLCANTCEDRGSIQPWRDDAVLVQVVPNDTLAGEFGDESKYLRNRIASAYFEQERRASGPWLTPGAGGTVPALLSRPWESAVPDAVPTAAVPVAIGALLKIDDRWVLDVWLARRDLTGTPARSGWEAHLGWRPWRDFLAQVLQFQAQLAVTPQAATPGLPTVIGGELFLAELLNKLPRSKKAVQDTWDKLLADNQLVVQSGILYEQGFRELPPAGFLALPAGEDVEPQILGLFGTVPVTVRHSSADAALRAVAAAQHLDRIPLHLDGAGTNPAVEVWVPDVAADLAAVSTPAYGWVAFTRDRQERAAVAPAPQRDTVAVHVYEMSYQHTPKTVADLIAKDPPGGGPVARLTYPADEWGVPADETQLGLIKEAYDKLAGFPLAKIIGTYVMSEDRPLALLRAELLGVWLLGESTARDAPLASTDDQTWVVSASADAIWLVFEVSNN